MLYSRTNASTNISANISTDISTYPSTNILSNASHEQTKHVAFGYSYGPSNSCSVGRADHSARSGSNACTNSWTYAITNSRAYTTTNSWTYTTSNAWTNSRPIYHFTHKKPNPASDSKSD